MSRLNAYQLEVKTTGRPKVIDIKPAIGMDENWQYMPHNYGLMLFKTKASVMRFFKRKYKHVKEL